MWRGFVRIGLLLPDGDGSHHLWYKQHKASSKSKHRQQADADKTLFVLNPPLDGQHALASIFSEAGPVDRVIETEIPGQRIGDPPVPVAHVVFKKAASVRRALEFDQSTVRKLPPAREGVYGLARWRKQYLASRPEPAALQKLVDAELNAFDDEKSLAEARRLALDGKEDEDGWTMVARGGKRVATEQQKPAKREKKDRELKNFYRFQQKEARKEQIATLRKKFDLDKLRVAQMKGDRKFRPY